MQIPAIRIGHGYDVHAFEDGDHLILGGVRIPYSHQFKAHSDGDVLLHALCDALLGALALGDIGQHFPDTSSEWENANSRDLLNHCYELVKDHNYILANLDATIIAQAPKMSPHIEQMRLNISDDLDVDISQINVKATTTEKLGYIGKQEGIAVHTVCLLQKIN